MKCLDWPPKVKYDHVMEWYNITKEFLGGDTLCDYGDVNCMECKDKFGGIQKWLQSEVEE